MVREAVRCDAPVITVADEYGRHSLQGGVPGLLRTPLVARRVRHCGVDDRASPKVEEEEHEDLAEPDIVGLHEVGRPRDVIPQEGRPALPVAAGPRATHVPLDGSLADADAELEELAAEALRAPARIAGGHLSDKRRTRGRGRPDGRARGGRTRDSLPGASGGWSPAR